MTKLTEIYNPHLPIILLSLKTKYAKQIIGGEQTVEHRKRFLHSKCQAIVYSSGIDKSVGLFLKLGIPAEVEDGYEIPIISFTEFNSTSLETLRENFSDFKTPRSYVYLDTPEKRDLLNYFLRQEIRKKL
ncbi:hypothetical protein [Companilactobacillus insicii]|uniref:hypothetical protein n=1 Tax=Companilactobacillus insicii TaxID=1732567 RepID=UPI000F7B4195|nr:hypothetical protein [Companilactobacillus insicii]